jgi:subtilase family serine protease
MTIKTIALKLAGGLLAATAAITALAGNSGPAAAGLVCKPNPCAAADSRPDLVVHYFKNETDIDGSPMVRFAVRNQGPSSATPFKAKVLVNGQFHHLTGTSSDLAPGAVMTFIVWPLPAGGKASVEVILDYDNQVDESNEGNNTALAAVYY